MKLAIILTSLFFSSLSMALDFYDHDFSGFSDEKRLNVKVHNICVGAQIRDAEASSYHISAKIFSELLYTNTAHQRRQKPISRTHEIVNFKDFYRVSDFESKLEGSPGFNKFVSFSVNFKDIKDLEFNIPMSEINNSLLLEATKPFKTGFNFFPVPGPLHKGYLKIVGIEIGLFNKKNGDLTFSTKVAFPNPSKLIGSNLDFIIQTRFDNETQPLYPRISVLNGEAEKAQRIQHIDETHLRKPKNTFNCDDGESGLDFSLEVL